MQYRSADQMYMYFFFTEKESNNVVTCQPFSTNCFKTLKDILIISII